MTGEMVYLDSNATTRPAEQVVEAIDRAARELWANPSSVHRAGQAARQAVELAREQVATLIGARPRELVFTSGGTESNHLAIHGLLDAAAEGHTLVTTRVEHSAVREPAEAFAAAGGDTQWLPVDADGRVGAAGLAALLRELAGRRVLVSVQWANNETGVIQPMPELAEVLAEAQATRRRSADRSGLFWHVDATQAVGKLPVDVAAAGCDLLTLAAHKFHGPKGVGGLWIRRGVRPQAVQRGGPQERQLRGGTENVPGIVGAGVAAQLAGSWLADESAMRRQLELRIRLEAGLLAAEPDAVINGQSAPRLWNTCNIGFRGLEAEAILLGLSERGLCASAGAACSSGSLDPSPVLLSMGIDEPVAHGSVRFSLSRESTRAEVDRAVELVPAVVGRLRAVMPV